MFVVFNLVLIGLVGIIAYWWANQGVFSALLHLVCVVIAGAIAIGLWEPLVVGIALRGSWFDYYAWGVCLILPFAILLFLLRFASDKIAPGNIDLPHWANLLFGLPVGALAGIITMGIVVIGVGHIQSHKTIMGYNGYGPDKFGEIVRYNKSMWLPVHQITAEFYGWLSVSSMWTPRPMWHYNPDLHQQASLVRVSYKDGVGQVSMPSDGVRVQRAYVGTDINSGAKRVAVDLSFDASALDHGTQLTISNSQLRLIGATSGKRKAKTFHPDSWISDGLLYRFDDFTHHITSTPGRESAAAVVLFEVSSDFNPKFIQIKGTRYRLPEAAPMPPGLLAGVVPGAGGSGNVTVDTSAPAIPASQIEVSNAIRPIRASTNMMPAGISEDDKYITEGFGEFRDNSGGMNFSRNLVLKGIHEPPGTKTIMLDISRGSVCDIFKSSVQDRVGDTDQLALVDATGNVYSPIGYIYEKGGGKVDLKMAPGKYLRTFDELPYLPTAGEQQLRLYFRVTAGVTITGFVYGDTTIGTCALTVPNV